MAARYKQPPELQAGMFVVLRDHSVGLVINDIIMGLDWFNPVSSYSIRDGHIQAWRWKFSNEDEFSRGSKSDIVAIYEVKDVGTCLEDIMKDDALQNYSKLLWKDTAE